MNIKVKKAWVWLYVNSFYIGAVGIFFHTVRVMLDQEPDILGICSQLFLVLNGYFNKNLEKEAKDFVGLE